MLQRKWGMHHPQRGYGMPRSGKRIGAWPKVEGAGLGGLRVNRAQSSDGNTMTVALWTKADMMVSPWLRLSTRTQARFVLIVSASHGQITNQLFLPDQ